MFRKGLDPIELHWQISALCFFNVSNRATFSKIFGRDFGAPKAQASLRKNVVDMVAALRGPRRQAARQLSRRAGSRLDRLVRICYKRTSSYIVTQRSVASAHERAHEDLDRDRLDQRRSSPRSSRRSPPRASTASRSSRTTSWPSTARRARSAAWCATPASTITLFQPFRDFEGLPEPQRARAFDRAERKFDVMQELGTDLMLVCSNVSPLALGGIDRAADDFRELGERAARRGLRVGYEALAWGRHVNDHRDAWEIVRRADHPNVGLILDSFHTLARKIDVGLDPRDPAATRSSSCSSPMRR